MPRAHPIPADFQAVADGKTMNGVAEHYRVQPPVVARWARLQPVEWQEAWNKSREQVRLAKCRENVAIARVRSLQEAEKRAAEQGRKVGERIRPSNAAPIPEGFYEAALTLTREQMSDHFRISKSMVVRMIDRLPDDQRIAVVAAGHGRKCAAASVNARKAGAISAASKKAKPGYRPRNGGFQKATDVAPLAGGLAVQAAQWLRRKNYIPVVRGDVIAPIFKGFYKVRTRMMPEAEMVELARREGWDCDEWRRVRA